MGKFKPLVPPGKRASKLSKPVTSLKLARKLTSKFHEIESKKEAILSNKELPEDERKSKLQEIENELAQYGGRDTYQEASILATKAFRSSRYVLKTLAHYKLLPVKPEFPIRILEVGAVNKQLSVAPVRAVVRAVDIVSQDPLIEQLDFFDIPVGSGTGNQRNALIGSQCSRLRCIDWESLAEEELRQFRLKVSKLKVSGASEDDLKKATLEEESENDESDDDVPIRGMPVSTLPGVRTPSVDVSAYVDSGKWNNSSTDFITQRGDKARGFNPIPGTYEVIVNSFVLNCMQNSEDRVRMLIKMRDHLVAGGILFFALPARCLTMSKFITKPMFEGLLSVIGFSIIRVKVSKKIIMYTLRRVDILPIYSAGNTLLELSMPSDSATSGLMEEDHPALVGSTEEIKKKKSNLCAHGDDWKPLILAKNEEEYALLLRMRKNPPVPLPAKEMPITGFSLTEFSLSIHPNWIIRGYTPPPQIPGPGKKKKVINSGEGMVNMDESKHIVPDASSETLKSTQGHNSSKESSNSSRSHTMTTIPVRNHSNHKSTQRIDNKESSSMRKRTKY